jgi:predicted  nucleic acid-binding Zn-ribbon protein
MIYSPARVHVEAGGTASLSIQLPSGVTDYKSGLTFWAFDDEGSVAKFGPVTQSGSGITIAGSSVSGDVRTVNMRVSGIFSDVGYTVFVSFGTEVETTKIVYGGSAGFPIAKIVEAIYKLQVSAGSLRREAQRAMRSPEADDDQILPMREIRKGRVLGFDAYGRPVSGLKNISEAKEFLDEMKRILADLVANADKMLEEFAETAKRIMDEKVAEATEIADNARKICEALAKEIREIRDRIEKLYAELTRYRYEVLTREEYEAKKAAGTLEADVIYFVKGTVAINDTLERLEEALSSLSEAYAELSARHDADVAALEGTIQATSDALDAAFAEATAAIEALEGKHDAESLAATQRLNDLQGGLQTLKARVDALQEQADASTAGVAENAAGIAELQQSLTEKTDALRGLIDALTTQVGEGDAENNAVARGLLDRMDAAEAKNDEQDAGIAGNAGEIAALKAQLESALNDDIPALLDFYTQAIADLQAKSGVATTTFSGTSKLSTATVMDVNDGKVGHDSNGALRVASATAEVKGAVYLPESETSGLTSAAASLELLRTKATASSVACGATDASDNCNQYSFVGPLSSLGVTGAAADLNSVTFYRRANNTPNGSTQVYLRLLKKVVGSDGNKTWQIASQSVNAVAFSAQPINGGKCGTFYMRRVAGVEPPTCAETVALVMVGAADAEVNTSLQFGCKVAPSATGGVCVSIPIADAITSDKGGLAVVPLVDVTWTPCAPAVGAGSYDAPGIVQLSLAATLIDDPLGIGKQADGRIVADMALVRAVVNAAVANLASTLEARVIALENANAALQAADADLDARVSALEAAAGGGNGGDSGVVDPMVETTLTEVVIAYTATSVFETVTEMVVKVDNAVDSEGNPVGVETMTEIAVSLPDPEVGETITETLTVIYPTQVDVLIETLVQLPTIVDVTETTLTETVVA